MATVRLKTKNYFGETEIRSMSVFFFIFFSPHIIEIIPSEATNVLVSQCSVFLFFSFFAIVMTGKKCCLVANWIRSASDFSKLSLLFRIFRKNCRNFRHAGFRQNRFLFFFFTIPKCNIVKT